MREGLLKEGFSWNIIFRLLLILLQITVNMYIPGKQAVNIYTKRLNTTSLLWVLTCQYQMYGISKLQFTFCLSWKIRCTEFCLNSRLIYHSSASQRQPVDENWLQLIIYQDHIQKQLGMYHQHTNFVEKIAELFGKSFIKIRNKTGPRTVVC